MSNVKDVIVVENIESYNSLLCSYAEALFQKAASQRYGVDFCCQKNLDELSLKKEKVELNDLCLITKNI